MLKYRLSKLADTELVDLVICGDESAIQYFFYDKYIPLFKVLFYKVASNRRVPFEDMLQELFIHFSKNDWEKLKKYDASCGKLKTWLSRVVYRFFDEKSSSMIDSAPHDPIDDMDSKLMFVDETFKVDMTIADIRNAMKRVKPPRDRDLLEALLIDEYEAEEVAKKFEVSIDYLYVIKNRALVKLRKLLCAYRIDKK